MNNSLSLIPLGGIGDITKNMYLYECNNQILIVDCGLGFADETMLGVDLLLPDISYLQSVSQKIVGMVLTHGHEDHIGALPFVLPQIRSEFPIFASPLTAAFANEKLKEFSMQRQVAQVGFDEGEKRIGSFSVSFIRVTHSVPDTSHIFIKTPAGNFYHGSDFKFDPAPYDKKTTDFEKIKKLSSQGVVALLSDCLGAEKNGRTGSEENLLGPLRSEVQKCEGKFIVTTYSSHIARLNQIIQVSKEAGRKVCFVGRSLIKAKEVAKKLGYLQIPDNAEIQIDEIRNYADKQLALIVAGSQGQEESAMSRIVNGEHREVKLREHDTVIFSADPIPGNEVSVYELIDTIAKRGVRVLYSSVSRNFHVSGHGSSDELKELIEMVKPHHLVPIGGAYRHMYMYKNLAVELGYKRNSIHLLDDGQEIIFSQRSAKPGRVIPIKNVYVDEISGEELESYVLRDRQKLSEGGIVIVLVEIDSSTGQLVGKPDVIVRGFIAEKSALLNSNLMQDFKKALSGRKGRITNWVHIRKLIGDISERRIFKDLRRRPLVLPVVIEV